MFFHHSSHSDNHGGVILYSTTDKKPEDKDAPRLANLTENLKASIIDSFPDEEDNATVLATLKLLNGQVFSNIVMNSHCAMHWDVAYDLAKKRKYQELYDNLSEDADRLVIWIRAGYPD